MQRSAAKLLPTRVGTLPFGSRWPRNELSAPYSPSSRGSHSESTGKYVTSISTANITP
jgi:hypothetical protein